MLHKLFGIRKHKPPPPSSSSAEERSSALKIIHAGGLVESYYMAVPANRIMEKYRSSILARPDVFRRPWDAVVRPEEILVPGQKFFIVPRRTLKKLRRRIRKPPGGESSTTHSFVSQSSTIDVSTEVVSQRKYDFSSKSFQQSDVSSISSVVGTSKNNGKTGVRIRRVRFFGIDTKQQDYSDSISMEKKRSNAEKNRKKKGPESQPKRRVRHVVSWQPTLTAIREIQGADD